MVREVRPCWGFVFDLPSREWRCLCHEPPKVIAGLPGTAAAAAPVSKPVSLRPTPPREEPAAVFTVRRLRRA